MPVKEKVAAGAVSAKVLEIRTTERISVSDSLSVRRIDIPREIKAAVSARMEAERNRQK